MSSELAYVIATSIHEEETFRDHIGIILSSTLKHHVLARDRNGNKTVVGERSLRPPFHQDVWHCLPVSFADLGESLLKHLTDVVECPDLRQEIVDSILSNIRSDAQMDDGEDLIMESFRAYADVALHTQEEAEAGSFDSVEDAETCGICREALWSGAHLEVIKMLPCDHVFHSSCLTPWLEKSPTCPFGYVNH